MKPHPLKKLADRFLAVTLAVFAAWSLCVLAGVVCNVAVRAFQMGWRVSSQLFDKPQFEPGRAAPRPAPGK